MKNKIINQKIKSVFLFAVFIILITPNHANAAIEYAENFKAYLENENLRTDNNAPLFKDDILAFYKARNFEPIWFDKKAQNKKDITKYKNAIINQAYENALEASDYQFNILTDKTQNTKNPNVVFKTEWMLTNTVMHYINDIRTGRIEPHKFDSMIFTLPQHRALDKRAADFLNARNPEKVLKSFAPTQSEYVALRDKLKKYRKIADQGGWPSIIIKKDTLIYPGEAHQSIPQIRERLTIDFHEYDGKMPKSIWIDKAQIATEEIADRIAHKNLATDEKDKQIAQNDPALVYDAKLAQKVAEFQYFHGKKADAVIGPETIGALNESVETHIDKIMLSMERWRWMPDDMGKKHVRVNIPAFYAHAIKNGKTQFFMPVIVGEVAHQTPVFSSVIKNVKIHPDWTSPDSISERYVIPKIQKNPGVIDALGYQLQSKATGEIVPWSDINIESLDKINLANYQFRQKPGNKNALGLARFSIENNYAIFMHGTPSQNLFNEDDRTYSSGCIRLEDPLTMANFLLNDEGMSKSEVETLYMLEDGEHPDTTYLDLKEDVPVHLLYMTAWIDNGGHLHFADDVYGRDKKLKQALKRLN